MNGTTENPNSNPQNYWQPRLTTSHLPRKRPLHHPAQLYCTLFHPYPTPNLINLHSRRLGQETEGNEGATAAGLEGDEEDEGTTLLLEQPLKVSMAPKFDISRVMTLAGPRSA